MGDEVIHELRWSLFGALLSLPQCDHCGGRGTHSCDAPMALLRDGDVVGRVDHPDAVVSWPACPRQYAALRAWGQDALTLADVLAWEVDRGSHMSRTLPAGAARLFREYLTLRDWPARIAEARAIKKAKQGRP